LPALVLLLLFLLPAALAFCACAGGAEGEDAPPETPAGAEAEAAARDIVDMAGRTVRVPASIEKVYSTGQPGVVMLYTLCPDKLLGWCIAPSGNERAYLSPKYLSLPVLGLMQGGNSTASREEILRRGPDVILIVTEIGEDAVRNADEIQEAMGLPVMVADFAMKSLRDCYAFLGGLLDERERAEELGAYCASMIAEAEAIAARIPEDERLSVYYAQGSDGLQTAPKGSSHSEIMDLVGGENVVRLAAGSDGRLGVNIEQLLLWNPDVVISSYSMGHAGMKTGGGEDALAVIQNAGEAWRRIKAVRENRVFAVPCLPYNWLDMPPSANRVIGVRWLGNLLYPEYFDYDIREETLRFYALFYRKNLSEAELDALLFRAAR
jgi:iron complex transport system substrate-binding protein